MTNKDISSNENIELDEDLYSRQLYVIGHEAMRTMMKKKVLLIGLDGLGQEIAKNIILAGIKSLDLYDKTLVAPDDLGAGFYFSKESIAKPRDESAHARLIHLNKYVIVSVVPVIDINRYNIVILVNQTLEYNIEMNQKCHNSEIKFLMATVSGLFSQIFTDFGEHECLDKNGEPVSTGGVNDISDEGVLTIADGSRHALEDGDTVKVDGKKYIVEVINRTCFRLIGYSLSSPSNKSNTNISSMSKTNISNTNIGNMSINTHTHSNALDYEQVKEPFTISFRSLKETIENPIDSEIISFGDETKAKLLHSLFTDRIGSNIYDHKQLVEQFVKTRGVLIMPMCSIVGGFVAQEVLKAATGKFNPLKQFFYYDCADAYNNDCDKNKNSMQNCINENINDTNNTNTTRYKGMKTLFGEDGFRKLADLNLFLVGAGAIGCENMKNFIMCGIGSNGGISLTDMDSIEQSNLNRQFLFRECDVSKMKAEAAARQACALNEDFPSDRIKHFNTAVNKDTESVFTDVFLSSQDVISNALDNIEARAYMDQRCIKLLRPMFDAGTLGTKGHVQVVLPFVSESYGSSSDAPESSIPLCTVKSYPSSIEHTIEWALGEFKTLFTIDDTIDDSNDIISNRAQCIKQSLSLFSTMFSSSIQKLLSTFPADHITNEGMLFWSPPKRPPTPISFNINDKLHILFVKSTANLYAECYGLSKISDGEINLYLENLLSLKEPDPLTFSEESAGHPRSLEFDKDTWHVDFIFACANLRARNYKIKEQSKHFIRGVAGKIIPAIATTTAVVSGLQVMEIIKYMNAIKDVNDMNHIGDVNIIKHTCKNSFLDLALPFLASTDLIAPIEQSYKINATEIKYNLWSRLQFKDCSLKSLVSQIEDKIKASISMVSIGPKVVFWNICQKYEANLEKTISELCCKYDGQLVEFVEVLTEEEIEIENIAVIFE